MPKRRAGARNANNSESILLQAKIYIRGISTTTIEAKMAVTSEAEYLSDSRPASQLPKTIPAPTSIIIKDIECCEKPVSSVIIGDI